MQREKAVTVISLHMSPNMIDMKSNAAIGLYIFVIFLFKKNNNREQHTTRGKHELTKRKMKQQKMKSI